jgi:hypothetical protein
MARHLTYLCPSVETEPDSRASSLFLLRVPLRCKQREAWCYRRLEHAQKESNRDCTRVVLHRCEARQYQAPHDDVERRYRESANTIIRW